MIAEIKEKWLEALKSGRYKKGKDRLRRDNEYCCLGVLCDVVDPDGWNQFGNPDFHKLGSISVLYPDTLEKLNITDNQQQDLINLNDGYPDWYEVISYIENM